MIFKNVFCFVHISYSKYISHKCKSMLHLASLINYRNNTRGAQPKHKAISKSKQHSFCFLEHTKHTASISCVVVGLMCYGLHHTYEL